MFKKKDNEFKDLEKFWAWYASKRPPTVYLVKNKQRYDEAMQAINTIFNLAYESNPDETFVSVRQDELLGTALSVEIISNVIVFEDTDAFGEAVKKADTYETMGLGDGKFQCGLTFEDVYDLAMPTDHSYKGTIIPKQAYFNLVVSLIDKDTQAQEIGVKQAIQTIKDIFASYKVEAKISETTDISLQVEIANIQEDTALEIANKIKAELNSSKLLFNSKITTTEVR